jgi:L-galactose dehydrogenase
MEYRKLGTTGLSVSKLSMGASALGGVFQPIDEAEGIRTVHTALDLGINYLDTSPYYGLTESERVLGKAISQVSRDSFLLSTKAGRNGTDDFDFSASALERSVEDSLRRLRTDYIDILFLHDIEFASLDQIVEESIPAMEKLREKGWIRHTGISGLPLGLFPAVLKRSSVDCVLSYCHCTLNDQTLLELVPFLDQQGAGLVNASPLSMGLLSGTAPPAWHPAPAKVKQRCLELAAYCEERGICLPQLAIQYSVSHQSIPTTLVSTAEPRLMEQNIRWASEEPDPEQLEQVLSFLKPIHNETWLSGRPENNEGV